jgi:organic hydroperoxide reductase OsmC/OhrA
MSITHRYDSSLRWTGSTASGIAGYSREHFVSCPPARAQLTLSADPHFRGDEELVNPEQLLLAAASSCQLLSFLAVCARARLDVVGYADDAVAFMSGESEPMRIDRIVLRPRVRARGDISEEGLRRLLALAHEQCFIANSLRSQISIEPLIRIERAPSVA